MRLGSLQRRLFVGAALFILAALAIAGIAIGLVLHRFARGQIDSRLDAEIAALSADLERGPRGIALRRRHDGPPFDRGPPGWYWQVRSGDTVLRSGPLDGRDLALSDMPPQDDGEPGAADGTGPRGEALILRMLRLPAEGRAPPVTIVASAPAAALQGPLREAGRTLALTLALTLGLLGLCLLAGVVAQVRIGLRPLAALRNDLASMRAAGQPEEVRPMVDELNLLLDQNAANLERARAHVANLAHGLKTPLATLAMALDGERDPDGRLSSLVSGMDRRVRHHLRRARAAALGPGGRTRSDLNAHVADLVATLARLHAERGLTVEDRLPPGLSVACEGEDLDEMLGNLIDNACRYAARRVTIAAVRRDATLVITVEDDGRGLDADAIALVLQRGRRLDESVPGDGFGLPITLELAELYGGGLELGRAEFGGLRVALTLPVHDGTASA